MLSGKAWACGVEKFFHCINFVFSRLSIVRFKHDLPILQNLRISPSQILHSPDQNQSDGIILVQKLA